MPGHHVSAVNIPNIHDITSNVFLWFWCLNIPEIQVDLEYYPEFGVCV